MTSPSKNRKRLQILASARDLFWKYGFRRVPIEEICRHAGASKMTFYRFFPNKIELAKAVFDEETARGLERFRTILREESSSAEKIRKIFLLKMEGTNNISKEFLQDFYGNAEVGLKQYIDQKTRDSWNEVLSDFRYAQEQGWFRRDLKPEFLYYFSQKVGDMLTDEKLLSLYPTAQELIKEVTNFFAYGISPADQAPASRGGENALTQESK